MHTILPYYYNIGVSKPVYRNLNEKCRLFRYSELKTKTLQKKIERKNFVDANVIHIALNNFCSVLMQKYLYLSYLLKIVYVKLNDLSCPIFWVEIIESIFTWENKRRNKCAIEIIIILMEMQLKLHQRKMLCSMVRVCNIAAKQMPSFNFHPFYNESVARSVLLFLYCAIFRKNPVFFD